MRQPSGFRLNAVDGAWVNNWSPYMVADPNLTWMGLEYFCGEGDSLWSKSDRELIELPRFRHWPKKTVCWNGAGGDRVPGLPKR
jgi:hypothetical protein